MRIIAAFSPSLPVLSTQTTRRQRKACCVSRPFCSLNEPVPLTPPNPTSEISPAVASASLETLVRKRDVDGLTTCLEEMEGRDAHLEMDMFSSVIDLLVSSSLSRSQLLSNSALAHRLCRPPGFASQGISSSYSSSGGDSNGGDSLPKKNATSVVVAASFIAFLGGCAMSEIIEPILFHHTANDTNTLLFLLCCSFAFDRYYSESKLWRYLTSGFSRLMSNDPKRASRVDAAHFLSAYYLGFPWEFLDANDTVLAYLKENSAGKEGLPEVDSALVWLLSGAAAEAAIDGVLIESDPSCAARLLKQLGIKSRERRKRVEVAYGNARKFVKENQHLLDSISRMMYEGGSCGDCLEYLALQEEER